MRKAASTPKNRNSLLTFKCFLFIKQSFLFFGVDALYVSFFIVTIRVISAFVTLIHTLSIVDKVKLHVKTCLKSHIVADIKNF